MPAIHVSNKYLTTTVKYIKYIIVYNNMCHLTYYKFLIRIIQQQTAMTSHMYLSQLFM